MKRHYIPRNLAEWVVTVIWIGGGVGAMFGGLWIVCKVMGALMGVLT